MKLIFLYQKLSFSRKTFVSYFTKFYFQGNFFLTAFLELTASRTTESGYVLQTQPPCLQKISESGLVSLKTSRSSNSHYFPQLL